MKNLTTRRIENIVTKTGVCLLVVTTIVLVLLITDNEYSKYTTGRNYSSRYGDTALYLFGIFSLLIFVCATVATMLNVSRIANAIEDIAECQKACVDKAKDDVSAVSEKECGGIAGKDIDEKENLNNTIKK